MSICAEEAGKDACQGDSGGPLVIPEPGNGRYALVGVVRSEHEADLIFRSDRISSVYIVSKWVVGCGLVTLFQNLLILSVVVL